MSCQVSREYRSEHDGQTAARRLLHRVNAWCSRPRSSRPARWIGLAQNPTASTRCHQASNPAELARRIIWATTPSWSISSGRSGRCTGPFIGCSYVASSIRGCPDSNDVRGAGARVQVNENRVALIRNFIELLSLLNRRAPGPALLPVQMDKLDIATTNRGHLGHLRDISDTVVDRLARACTRFLCELTAGRRTRLTCGDVRHQREHPDSRRAEADRGRTRAEAMGVGLLIVLGIVLIVVHSALVR